MNSKNHLWYRMGYIVIFSRLARIPSIALLVPPVVRRKCCSDCMTLDLLGSPTMQVILADFIGVILTKRRCVVREVSTIVAWLTPTTDRRHVSVAAHSTPIHCCKRHAHARLNYASVTSTAVNDSSFNKTGALHWWRHIYHVMPPVQCNGSL